MIPFGPISLDPVEIGSQGNAILGIRDSGKSYTATLLAEGLFDAGIPFIAFDPIGVWRFLRVPGGASGKGYPIVVAGGEEGDLPLSPASAPLIVEAAMQNGVSLVIDLFHMELSKADWRRIVRDCVRLLLHRNKAFGLRHIFLEEAAEFAPQTVRDGDVYAEIEKLARMGGNSRLGYTLINQRSQEVNKAVLELCDNLFLHRQKGKNSLENLKKWMEVAGAAGGEVMRTLPTLPQGECWAWLSSSDTPVHVRVPAKRSLHPDRRIMHNDVAAEVVKKAAVDVGQFVAQMQAALPRIEEETKANDPKALKAEVSRLTRELAKVQRQVGAPPAPVTIVANADEVDAARMEGQRVGIALGIARAQNALKALRVDEVAPPAGEKIRSGQDGARAAVRRTLPLSEAAAHIDASTVPAGCAKPLAALAGVYPAGLTEPQWATAAGYKRSGGTWGTYKGRLRGAGLIQSREGRWFATQAGAEAVGDVELPPSPGPDLVRWWAAKLPGTSRMAEVLIEAGPDGLTRDALATRLDMAAGGGSFGTYISRLAGPGLIERSGGIIRLSPDVLP